KAPSEERVYEPYGNALRVRAINPTVADVEVRLRGIWFVNQQQQGRAHGSRRLLLRPLIRAAGWRCSKCALQLIGDDRDIEITSRNDDQIPSRVNTRVVVDNIFPRDPAQAVLIAHGSVAVRVVQAKQQSPKIQRNCSLRVILNRSDAVDSLR